MHRRVDRAVGLPMHVGKIEQTPTNPSNSDASMTMNEFRMANPAVVHREPTLLDEAECAAQAGTSC
jgi:hypothetical protein